jgi:hypothetical protein
MNAENKGELHTSLNTVLSQWELQMVNGQEKENSSGFKSALVLHCSL